MVNKLFIVGFVTLAMFSASPVLARETYVVLVARMVGEAMSNKLEREDLELKLFLLANSFRQANGVAALKLNQTAHNASLAHAMDMLQHNYMGHIASTGQDFDSRMRALRNGAMALPSMGENAARLSHSDVGGPDAANKIFEQWVKSPPHRHTLLSRDYISAATGVVAQGGKIYADQIFVGPEVVTNMTRAVSEQSDGLY